MKIYWPIGLTREMPGRTNRSDLFDQTLNEYARSVMGPNVEVTIAWMKRTTGMMSSAYLAMWLYVGSTAVNVAGAIVLVGLFAMMRFRRS